MKREFTKREETLLLILVILLLITGYYFCVALPVRERISAAENETAAVQDQITVEAVKAGKLQMMKTELETLQAEGALEARLPDYDNLQQVILQLDGMLSAAAEYEMTFPSVELGEKIVIRPVQMTVTCANYAAAKEVLQRLNDCIYRCRIDTISVSVQEPNGELDITEVPVVMDLTVLFYEKNTLSVTDDAVSG